MVRGFGMGLLLALVAAGALAKKPVELPAQAELSMLVTGTISIQPDGGVSGWEIDQREELPDFVVNLIEKSVPAWKFEPVLVDGQPRRAKARMSLRVVANRLDDGKYAIAIRSGHFGKDAMAWDERREHLTTDDLVSIDQKPPMYPPDALMAGIQGTAYLVLRIGRSGVVEDVAVEQVDLRVRGTAPQMQRMRNLLAKPAVAAARRWTYRVPTTGEDADRAYWSVRVPVDYALADRKTGAQAKPGYGQWEAYIPGPRQEIPWDTGVSGNDESLDAMVAGQLYQIGKGLKLLTPLQG